MILMGAQPAVHGTVASKSDSVLSADFQAAVIAAFSGWGREYAPQEHVFIRSTLWHDAKHNAGCVIEVDIFALSGLGRTFASETGRL